LNASETDKSICHSHDFCDANMAMDEAFTKVLGRQYVFFNDEEPETEKQNEIDADLINAAWSMAKANKFYAESNERLLSASSDLLDACEAFLREHDVTTGGIDCRPTEQEMEAFRQSVKRATAN
jgi:hypothetical protein